MKKTSLLRMTGLALAGTLLSATAITAVAHAHPGGRGGLGELVSEGVITKTEAQAYLTELREVARADDDGERDRSEIRSTALKNLVSDGVLTQAQADAIAEAMPERRGWGRGGLGELVSEGVITKTEAKAYLTELREVARADDDGERDRSEIRSTALKNLVSDGVLTQAQADAIAEAMPERRGWGRGTSTSGGYGTAA